MGELNEFGRVYRTFRQEHPHVDIAESLDASREVADKSLQVRRTMQRWIPEKMLCRRWGVPEPTVDGELASARRQREYQERVQAGLAKAKSGWDVPPEIVQSATV